MSGGFLQSMVDQSNPTVPERITFRWKVFLVNRPDDLEKMLNGVERQGWEVYQVVHGSWMANWTRGKGEQMCIVARRRYKTPMTMTAQDAE